MVRWCSSRSTMKLPITAGQGPVGHTQRVGSQALATGRGRCLLLGKPGQADRLRERRGAGELVVQVSGQADRDVEHRARGVADQHDVIGGRGDARQGVGHALPPGIRARLAFEHRRSVGAHRPEHPAVRDQDQVGLLRLDAPIRVLAPPVALGVDALEVGVPLGHVGRRAGRLREVHQAPAAVDHQAIHGREPAEGVAVPHQDDRRGRARVRVLAGPQEAVLPCLT